MDPTTPSFCQHTYTQATVKEWFKQHCWVCLPLQAVFFLFRNMGQSYARVWAYPHNPHFPVRNGSATYAVSLQLHTHKFRTVEVFSCLLLRNVMIKTTFLQTSIAYDNIWSDNQRNLMCDHAISGRPIVIRFFLYRFLAWYTVSMIMILCKPYIMFHTCINAYYKLTPWRKAKIISGSPGVTAFIAEPGIQTRAECLQSMYTQPMHAVGTFTKIVCRSA